MSGPDYSSLCPGCFNQKGKAVVCPHCGYDESIRKHLLALPDRTQVNQYLIGRVLGKPGGFGITYLALDTGPLKRPVAIKEYLPKTLAGREGSSLTVSAHSTEDEPVFRYGLEAFLREAQTLDSLNHPNIVRVRTAFEANGTAYLVMDFYEGETLEERLGREGRLSQEGALMIMDPVLAGLEEIHRRDFVHRDIKPENIYLTRAGVPVLLDFGAARVARGDSSHPLTIVLTRGYAPIEQYLPDGKQGSWTDVYACAAVLYRMVTGEPPPEPPSEENADADFPPDPRKVVPGLSKAFAEALRRGMARRYDSRPKTVADFRALLALDPPTPPWRRRLLFAGVVAGVLLAVLVTSVGMVRWLAPAVRTFPEGLRFIELAAQHGRVAAHYRMGRMYERGEGTGKDLKRAKDWYEQAAQRGHLESQHRLGWMYQQGVGVAKNAEQAKMWYEKAAQRGYAKSQYNLAILYRRALHNEAMASVWYHAAAESEFALAEYNLGVFYAKGELGLRKDVAEAKKWFCRALEHGYQPAEEALAKLGSLGSCVTPSTYVIDGI